MKRKCLALALCFMTLLFSTGCQNRYTVPNRAPKISAAKNRADFYYGTVKNDTGAQIGMNGNAPATYTVPGGSRVKIMGKYDGFHVAVLPNGQIGLIPQNSTSPVSPQASQNTPSAGLPGNVPPTGSSPAPSGSSPAPFRNTPMIGSNPTPSGGNPTSQPSGLPPAPSPSQTPGGMSGPSAPTSPAGGTSSADTSSMISLVNQSRSQSGLNALNSNGDLARLANMKAADIVSKNYFSHTSPTYGSPFDMMKSNGVSYLYAGENLAINQDVQSAETDLMNSPEHKANILNHNFTDIGVGVAQKSDGSKVYVQMFIGK